jgi:hypothetical protein
VRPVGGGYPKKFGRRELAYFAIRVWWKPSDTFSWNVQPMRISSSQYENNLKVDNMHQLFDEDKINQIASLLVKIHNRRYDIEKSVKMS